MKNKISTLLTASALLACSLANADTLYDFTYTGFDDGSVVSGSFFGTANGDLITGLSNIQASVNGVALVTDASGYLHGASFDFSNTASYVPGTAVVSFDGLHNNFIFADVDYSSSQSATNFMQSITDPSWAAGAFLFGYSASANAFANTGNNASGLFDASLWSVTAVSSVPLPATTWLFLSGLLGILGVRRQLAAKHS